MVSFRFWKSGQITALSPFGGIAALLFYTTKAPIYSGLFFIKGVYPQESGDKLYIMP